MSAALTGTRLGALGRLLTAAFAASLLVAVIAPGAALGARAAETILNVPATRVVGDTSIPGSIVVINKNTAPDGVASLTGVSFHPSCGGGYSPVSGCVDFPEAGVMSVNNPAMGGFGTACAGRTFNVSAPHPDGTVVITPQGAGVALQGAGAGAGQDRCRIEFTMSTLRVPTTDVSPSTGVQTNSAARAFLTNGPFIDPSDEVVVTVNKATPGLTTQVSAAATQVGTPISDTATLAGGYGPSGSVTFDLYGPTDATCVGPPVATSNVAISSATATSDPYTPSTPGTYRFIARYGGDANHHPRSGACDDTGERVEVGLDPVATIEDADIAESAGNAAFVVTLSAPTTVDVRFAYATSDGTATAGTDYTATSGVLTIVAGATTGAVVVPIAPDTVDEPAETLLVTLSNPQGAALGDAQAVGTIRDDDGVIPDVRISDAARIEGNTGTTNLSFRIALSVASLDPVTVTHSTAHGSARGADYVRALPTLLTFAPGETGRTIRIALKGDIRDEANERFFVNLTAPVNATISDGQAAGTIRDDDLPPTVSVADVTVTEPDAGITRAIFRVSLSAPSGRTIRLRFATVDDSALAPADFTALAGELTFTPGQRVRTIVVLIRGDRVRESDERFFVDLSRGVYVTVADRRARGLIRNDD